MGCKQSVYVSQDVEHKKCLEYLGKEPNLKEYQGDGDALKMMGKMYKNQIYGTSVLNPVGDTETKKRTKKNPLTGEINSFNVQHLYLGGWKEIAHVKVHEEEDLQSDEGALYCHINLLVNSIHMSDEKNLIMQSDKIPMKDRLHIGELEFDQIKSSMNGFGRVIFFRAHGDHKSANQSIEYIQEGKFKNGLMDGYCREFSIHDGEAPEEPCRNLQDFYDQGHLWGSWVDKQGSFYNGNTIKIKKDHTWSHGQVEWDDESRLSISDANNNHLISLINKNIMEVTRESDGDKWTLHRVGNSKKQQAQPIKEAICQLGYFKDGQPQGKYQSFDIDGNCLEEGIKEGDVLKKEIRVQNYLTQTVSKGATPGIQAVKADKIAKKYPDGPIDKSKCTHICKWDNQATGGRWFECVILNESEAFYKVKGFDGDTGNIPKGDLIKKSGKGKVDEGDAVVAYYDDRANAFQGVCTGVSSDGIAVTFADGDQGLAWEGKVWKLIPM